ncbi:hypothetical protein GF374_03430 [Candidatus Woesearchaeota archaeon]|nr:hypothetical protein [Candidatus Woesearchaeota archaeon]
MKRKIYTDIDTDDSGKMCLPECDFFFVCHGVHDVPMERTNPKCIKSEEEALRVESEVKSSCDTCTWRDNRMDSPCTDGCPGYSEDPCPVCGKFPCVPLLHPQLKDLREEFAKNKK